MSASRMYSKKAGYFFYPLLRTSLIAVFLTLIFASYAIAKGLAVVVQENAEVTSLTRQEVANLFLGSGQANSHLIPFDQSDLQLRKLFYREIAGLTVAGVRARWAKQVFSGRGRPPAMLEATEVGRVLNNTSGAILYVPLDRLPEGSRVLLILDSGETK